MRRKPTNSSWRYKLAGKKATILRWKLKREKFIEKSSSSLYIIPLKTIIFTGDKVLLERDYELAKHSCHYPLLCSSLDMIFFLNFSGELSSTATLRIHVSDANDNQPILKDFTLLINTYEEGPYQREIGAIPALWDLHWFSRKFISPIFVIINNISYPIWVSFSKNHYLLSKCSKTENSATPIKTRLWNITWRRTSWSRQTSTRAGCD